jgi:DUF4097 and DUF4098 domain-containing protein YvlB
MNSALNSRTRKLYLLSAALLAAACHVGEQREVTIDRKWTTDAIRRIEVREVDGSVSVEAGKPGEISLSAHVRTTEESKPKRDNQGFFRSDLTGDTLEIGRNDRRRGHLFSHWFGPEISIDYTLHVPPSVALELHTVNGRIATSGMDAATEAHTVNGSINLENSGQSTVDAKTVNGRVFARFAKDFQGAHLKTVNGRVEAVLPPSASFVCDLSQVNGDFEAGFPLSIHSHPGSRRVSGEVNGGRHELRISTVNGDIALETTTPIPPVPPVPPTAPVPPVPPATPARPAPPANPST